MLFIISIMSLVYLIKLGEIANLTAVSPKISPKNTSTVNNAQLLNQ